MPSPVTSATRSGVNATKGRPLKQAGLSPSKSLNTDPNAYPRTNPIGALSTLLKLLSSLSSRVGRCQYKLTPTEHALSLHLVSILDPYVYQGAKTLSTVVSAQTKPIISGLVYQPTEILDSIMSYLDSKRDLLNVALCCKHLHDVVFPRHFEYRFIRCKVSSISVWNHLLVNHSLARNVRRLEIVDERTSASTAIMPRGTVVPRGINKRDTDLESTDDELGMHKKQERYFGLALQRMSGLKELKWSCNHSPISIEHIWPALLMRCTTLDTLEIADNLIFTSKDSEREETATSSGDSDGEKGEDSGASPSVLPMSTLTTAVFKSTRHNYGARKNPDISRITGILGRCPSLKNLQVSFVRPARPQSGLLPVADELLDRRWLNLTGISLTGLRCTSASNLSDFLSEHSQLERLYLDVVGIYRLDLRPDSLPNVKEITAGKEILNAILRCNQSGGEGAVRPIESVKGFKLSGVHATVDGKHVDHELFHNLRKHAKTLHRVELGGWHDMEDIRKLANSLPGLTYLDLGKRLNVNTNRGVVGPVTNFEEWLEVLLTLPELRALHGVKFFYEISTHNIPTHHSSALNPTAVVSSTASTSTPQSIHNQALTTGNMAALLGDSVVAAKMQSQMSLMDRSRMKKNDWTASMLVWRCPKLRRVDYWEDGSSRIIVLTRGPNSSSGIVEVGGGEQGGEGGPDTPIIRESNKVRWEVRRLKSV